MIDDWYKKTSAAKGSYHLDTGEGCDCYNVGQTLGMGASAPYGGRQIVVQPQLQRGRDA